MDGWIDELRRTLADRADPQFADGMQRYFPHEVAALGVRNAEVSWVARDFLRSNPHLDAETTLELASEVIQRAAYHEEVLLGFALLHKAARRRLGVGLLDLCRAWLEEAVTNWAQCDDLCLKLLYPYFLGHLDLIPQTQRWVDSSSPWARRAANVAVVKFVRREVGGEVFELPLVHVFDNCTRLMHDEDDYVQKGCGWLLKVSAEVHPAEVSAFLRRWRGEMRRSTFRTAVEKMDPSARAALMAPPTGG